MKNRKRFIRRLLIVVLFPFYLAALVCFFVAEAFRWGVPSALGDIRYDLWQTQEFWNREDDDE